MENFDGDDQMVAPAMKGAMGNCYAQLGQLDKASSMLLGDFPIKREGSQGQNKTYLVALKLAQFDFLKRTGTTVPLLLLDDIFDKLDASRVEQIIKLVAGDNFGQIFITDTNREHLDRILHKVGSDYKMFRVEKGNISEMVETQVAVGEENEA